MPSADGIAAAELSDQSRSTLEADSTPASFVARLSEAGLFADAIKFMAQAMGPKQSIAWAVTCLGELGTAETQERTAALEASRRWLAEPSDGNRRSAQEAADKATAATPEGCVALAVFFAEGSIAPPNLQSVPPPPFVAAKIAASAVLLAAVQKEPEKAAERLKQCVRLGSDSAN